MRLTLTALLLSTCTVVLAAQNPPDGKVAPAIAHDGTEIRFRVAGSGNRFLFLGPASASASDTGAMRPWIDGLGKDYRLIFIDYPSEPKMYTLTPAAVARDYLAIADA